MLEKMYVLHRRHYRENSHLLDLYSQTQGKISVIHRTSKRKLRLQPFVLYGASITGKRDLKYLSAVETISSSYALHKQSLYCGFYINELLHRLLSVNEASKNIFLIYQQTLEILSHTDQVEPCLRRFEYKLLTELGYGFSWEKDDQGSNILDHKYYYFSLSKGFYLADTLFYNDNHPKVKFFSGEIILSIGCDNWEHIATWKVAKDIMREALAYLLGNQPLMSRRLFIS
jgi:DNA repair protein RecO (recombination protein O)